MISPTLRQSVPPAFEEIVRKELKAAARLDTKIDIKWLEKGPASVESKYDEEIAAPWFLEAIRDAERKGYDAVLIGCVADPSLQAAREIVGIPVVAPCMASMALASTIGRKFSIVTVTRNAVRLFEDNSELYGFRSKLISVRSIDVSVLESLDEGKRDKVQAAVVLESKKAMEEGADTIILGCAAFGWGGMVKAIEKELGIPVINPVLAALKLAETLVEMGLTHSKVSYPTPPEKLRIM